MSGAFCGVFTARGIDTAVAPAFNAEYQIRLGDTIKFCPHALETVQALRGIAAQCAVTNGTKIARRKSSSVSLMPAGPGLHLGGRARKNRRRRSFAPVFAAFPGIKPEEMLIVGDSLTSDIRGGVNAGIQTCWYNPRGHAAPPELRIDYTVSDIAEVLQIVEESAQ